MTANNVMFVEEDKPNDANAPLRLPPRVRSNMVQNAPSIQQPAMNTDSGENKLVVDNDQPAPPKDTWFHRRTMAYIALITMVVVTILIFLVNPAHIEKITVVLSWIYPPFAAIVMTYMGAATYSQIRGK